MEDGGEDPALDSTFFVAFDLTHRALNAASRRRARSTSRSTACS